MVVKYSTRGVTMWAMVVHVGKTQKKIFFEHGSYSQLGEVPAIYVTGDEKIQKAIEDSKWFRNGRIKRDTPRQEPQEIPVKKDNTIGDEYPEVTTAQHARALLSTQYGVKTTLLTTKEEILSVAEDMNISFPNLKP